MARAVSHTPLQVEEAVTQRKRLMGSEGADSARKCRLRSAESAVLRPHALHRRSSTGRHVDAPLRRRSTPGGDYEDGGAGAEQSSSRTQPSPHSTVHSYATSAGTRISAHRPNTTAATLARAKFGEELRSDQTLRVTRPVAAESNHRSPLAISSVTRLSCSTLLCSCPSPLTALLQLLLLCGGALPTGCGEERLRGRWDALTLLHPL